MTALSFLFLFSNIAIATDSDFPRALALKNVGRLEEAESAFKKILETDPANFDAHFELANVYAFQYDSGGGHAREKLTQAARELEHALMLNPDSVAARFNLGVVYKKLGKYANAREEFKKVRVLVPGDRHALIQIGKTYEEEGFDDEAKSIYNELKGYDQNV